MTEQEPCASLPQSCWEPRGHAATGLRRAEVWLVPGQEHLALGRGGKVEECLPWCAAPSSGAAVVWSVSVPPLQQQCRRGAREKPTQQSRQERANSGCSTPAQL